MQPDMSPTRNCGRAVRSRVKGVQWRQRQAAVAVNQVGEGGA